MSDKEFVKHYGSCHCGKITFFAENPAENVTIEDCNCSICNKKGFLHLIVPKSRFHLLTGKDDLTIYEFGTKTAKHMFCKTCGVHPFYIPRSNPDGYSVNFKCLDHSTFKSFEIIKFDGKDNWDNEAALIANKSIE